MKTYETPKIEKMLGQVDKNEQIKVTVVTITYNLIKSGRSKFFKQWQHNNLHSHRERGYGVSCVV